jgi:hypothetical protein
MQRFLFWLGMVPLWCVERLNFIEPIRSRPFLQHGDDKTREPSPPVKKVAGPKPAPHFLWHEFVPRDAT